MAEDYCYFCGIIYGDEHPKTKSVAGSDNLIAVLEKAKKDKLLRILILLKKPEQNMIQYADTEEYKELLRLICKYTSKKLNVANAAGGIELIPCSRGYEYDPGQGKKHACVVVYPKFETVQDIINDS
ncbi:hypothetical protein GW950_00335 [Candidatus Wolfebacteria bacterium]|nr:hypothetical protein [Candidatus Wolfebacteria bacterium]